MSEKQIKEIERIKAQYEGKEISKLDILKELHREVKLPIRAFSYIFGTIGALVLGTGMCLAMPDVIYGYMPFGICIGIIGILMVSVNYPIYKKMLESRKSKYSARILEISADILNNN